MSYEHVGDKIEQRPVRAEKLPFWYRLDTRMRGATLLSFDGRISRSTFWLKGVLPLIGLFIVFSFVFSVIALFAPEIGVIVFLLLLLIWFGMLLAVVTKRLHDRDKSMWWILIYFIPIIGPWWLFIEVGFVRGTPATNRYGEQP